MALKKKVAVGMSGGVDSSVAALLLQKQGYEVIGLFIKSWEDEEGCTATLDYQDVAKVAGKLKIPYFAFDLTEEYKTKVFDRFIEDFKRGVTPNPDIFCNKEIKFKAFLEKAFDLKVDFLATGHYARTSKQGSLKKALDLQKDQSYFLHALNREILKKVLFPIGELKKSQVRKIAYDAGLATAEKKDSTGICFIGKRNFSNFLGRYIPHKKGNFETLAGEIVGEHQGISFYTIGQRKGIKIGGRGKAWFVVGKDIEKNVVFVEQGADNPALFSNTLIAREPTWLENIEIPLSCAAKIRYRQEDQKCEIAKIDNGKLIVSFSKPQRAITPGQAIVFYKDELCLGGATIENAASV